MAGKTFQGIGDIDSESPPLDPADAADSSDNAQTFYSGPTVVDDAKVEQGLKKLRSLDAPAGPDTGIQRAVASALMPQASVPVTPDPRFAATMRIDPTRETAIGRGVNGPLPGQQTTPAPFDDRHLRGTMFGHSVHLPELDRPPTRRDELDESSKALAVVDRAAPTSHEIAVFQPGAYPRYRNPPSSEAPYPRADRFQHPTPIEVQAIPTRRNLALRVVFAAGCVGLIVVAVLVWMRASAQNADTLPRTGATAPALMPRIDIAPVTPPPAIPKVIPPEDFPPPQPNEDSQPEQDDDARAAKDVPRHAVSAAGTESTGHRTHGGAHGEHRHVERAAKGTHESRSPKAAPKAETTVAPSAPGRPKRSVEDDPDGTMAPSIE